MYYYEIKNFCKNLLISVDKSGAIAVLYLGTPMMASMFFTDISAKGRDRDIRKPGGFRQSETNKGSLEEPGS